MAERDPAVIGARIARRRHQLEMTQIELAEALSVSPSTVANWERGVSYPARKIGKIEQLLGSLDDPQRHEAQDLDQAEAEAERVLATIRRMRAEREHRERERERRPPEDGEGEERRA